MAQIPAEAPEFEQFELQQLADGVYAALGIKGAATFSNAGIIDLGDQTLIFDTFELPSAGEELRQAAEHLTGRPASCIVISHSHGDHWGGNQSFSRQVPILATRECRETMFRDTDYMVELKEDPTDLENAIQQARDALETETDEKIRAQLQRSIARMSGLLAELPSLELRLPDVTIDGQLAFHGTRRTVELRTVAPGHTASDTYLVLPAEGIMFMGDLGFFQSQPFMAFCDPQAWQRWLLQQEGTAFTTFVPGHGPLGTRQDLTLQRRYMSALIEMVGRVIGREGTVTEALEQTLPAPFDEWARLGAARWQANVQTMYERYSGQGAAAD